MKKSKIWMVTTAIAIIVAIILGYNFLNQACSFENFVSQKLKTAQIYQNKNEKDIFYNLDYVLNGEVLKRCKQYGINPKILRLENAQPVTPEKIADNLNPIILSNILLVS